MRLMADVGGLGAGASIRCPVRADSDPLQGKEGPGRIHRRLGSFQDQPWAPRALVTSPEDQPGREPREARSSIPRSRPSFFAERNRPFAANRRGTTDLTAMSAEEVCDGFTPRHDHPGAGQFKRQSPFRHLLPQPDSSPSSPVGILHGA